MSNRADARGFFWEDLPPPKKEKKEVVKRVAPDPVWLLPDYLPGLEEAKRFPIVQMNDNGIMLAHLRKEELLFDIESYHNYFCAVFRSYVTGEVIVFESSLDENGIPIREFDVKKFQWILENFTLYSFNGINYDIPICELAAAGHLPDVLKQATNEIIEQGFRPADIRRKYKAPRLKVDHIDLIEVAPLHASLKTYGGRLHVPRMQDLPFHPNAVLTEDQMDIVKWYCVNDTTSTGFLKKCLQTQIDLRVELSNENGIDLRSKSDAQIAEAIIGAEFYRLTRTRATRPEISPGTVYYYEKPASLGYQTPLMQGVLNTVCNTPFEVGFDGKIGLPEAIKKLQFQIGDTTYQMGTGGLHSMEKSIAHHTDDYWQLIDADVASYYPRIIINNRYYPEHMGPIFLDIYGGITQRRLSAKAAGLKAIADSLKIVINGTFGKLLSPYSIVYAPKLGFHVTVGGQLFLLMLIEALEMNGIKVVSANTDGIMIKCPKHLIPLQKQIMSWWEQRTGFETEGKNYRSLYSRDINNYIAIDEKGVVKHKGAYANPWNDPKENPEKKLHKNPVTTICIEAVDAYLLNGTPLEHTIRACTDIRKFTRMQSVTGGAVKNGDFLGKQIRWYYAAGEQGEIIKAKNGHKVGSSDGARPLMQLPDVFPNDIDYEWYVNNSLKILSKIGAVV